MKLFFSLGDGKTQNFTFIFPSLLSFSSDSFLNLFIQNSTMQNKIESEMDEVENDSSNFICHRPKKANTQTRRLISEALFHPTNTGNSSTFSVPVMCFWLGSLHKWVNICEFLPSISFSCRKRLKTPAPKDLIPTKSFGEKDAMQSRLVAWSIPTRISISIG